MMTEWMMTECDPTDKSSSHGTLKQRDCKFRISKCRFKLNTSKINVIRRGAGHEMGTSGHPSQCKHPLLHHNPETYCEVPVAKTSMEDKKLVRNAIMVEWVESPELRSSRASTNTSC